MNNTVAATLPSPDFGRTIKFCLGLILTSFLTMLFVALVTAGATIYFVPKEYFSKVTMEVKPISPQVSVLGASANTYDPQFTATQFVILQKTEILYPVIDRLNLVKDYAPRGEKLSVQDAYTRLKGSMKLQEVRNTGLIEIGVYDTDAQRAANIANTIAVIYKEKRWEDAATNVGRGIDQLTDELEKQRQRTEDAGTLAMQIRSRNDITDPDPDKEFSTIGIADDAAKALEAQAGASDAAIIEKAKMTEYVEAKKKAIQARKLLEAVELNFTLQKMNPPAVKPPTVIIWEKAEPSAYPARPNVALYALLAASVGLVLGVALFLMRHLKTRPGQ